MSNFYQRAITGAVFVSVLISSIFFSRYTFAALFFLITIVGTWEFYGLTEKNKVHPQKIYGTFVSGLIFLYSALHTSGLVSAKVLLLIIPFSFLIFIIELYKKSEDPFRNIAFTLLGFVYVAMPFAFLNYIVTPDLTLGNYYPENLLGYFFIVWASDTGAYLVGRKLGKTKLFERISPNKTWEGTIGGGILALIVAYTLSKYYTNLSWLNWSVIACIIVSIGSLGDLVESLFKRSINVKDSGTILPGHGGILDRFDSLILSSPFVFAYIIYIQ